MATFPAGKLLHNGYKRSLMSDVLRTPMESGPPKQALISSRTYRIFTVSYLFTSAEYDAFETWVADTIKFVGSFDWDDEQSGLTLNARIINGDISDAVPINPHLANWVVKFTLEVL